MPDNSTTKLLTDIKKELKHSNSFASETHNDEHDHGEAVLMGQASMLFLLGKQVDGINDLAKSISDAVVPGFKDSMKSIDKFLKGATLKKKREKLHTEETTSEAKRGKRFGRSKRFFSGMGNDFTEATKGTGITSYLTSIFTGITAILPRLKAIGKLFLKGGLVFAVVYAAWHLFKDIGENETFKAALVSMRSIWNDRIVPTWLEIKEMFTNFLNTDSMKASITFIKDMWASMVPNIKGAFQDLVSKTLVNITDTLAGILDGVKLLFEGDFLEGMKTIALSLGSGITKFFDNMISATLLAIGIDLGPDGVRGAIIKAWSLFTEWLKLKWSIMTDWFTVEIPKKLDEIKDAGFEKIGELKNSVKDFFSGLIGGIVSLKDVVVSSFQYFITKISNDLSIAFEKISLFFANMGDKIHLMLAEKFRFSMPEFSIPIPEKLQGWTGLPPRVVIMPGFDLGVGSNATMSEARTNIAVRGIESRKRVELLSADTAEALQTAVDAVLAMKGQGQSIIVAPTNAVSNNMQSAQTNITVHPLSTNTLGPQ